MKFRTDFVTNSSSASYILMCKNEPNNIAQWGLSAEIKEPIKNEEDYFELIYNHLFKLDDPTESEFDSTVQFCLSLGMNWIQLKAMLMLKSFSDDENSDIFLTNEIYEKIKKLSKNYKYLIYLADTNTDLDYIIDKAEFTIVDRRYV